MKIQTADSCNKNSSSFTNTRTLSTKDNLRDKKKKLSTGYWSMFMSSRKY